MSISRGQQDIPLDFGVNNLADDILVGDADDETVLGGVVLVLLLNDETLASIVISLAFAASAVLDLEALEVGLVLDNL